MGDTPAIDRVLETLADTYFPPLPEEAARMELEGNQVLADYYARRGSETPSYLEAVSANPIALSCTARNLTVFRGY